MSNPSRRYVVTVNAELCAASAVCMRLEPDIFDLADYSDSAEVKLPWVEEGEQLDRVKAAAENCPTWAIRWKQMEEQD